MPVKNKPGYNTGTEAEMISEWVKEVEEAAAQGPEHVVTMAVKHDKNLDLMPLLLALCENGVCVLSMTTNRRHFVIMLKKMDVRAAERVKRILNDAAGHHQEEAGGLAQFFEQLKTSTAFEDEVEAAVRDALAQISGGTHSFEVFGDTMMRVHDAAVKVVGRDPLEVEEAAADRSEHWNRIWEYVDRAWHRLDDELTRPSLH
jgi:hypothetical protein